MLELARREFLGSVAAASLLAGCKVSNAPGSGNASAGDLAKQLQAMADQMLGEYPENATILGIATGAKESLNHRLTDRTPEGVAARAAAARTRLTSLKELDLSDLGVPANLDAAVALAGHELADEGFRFPFGDPIVLDPNIGFRNTPYVVNQLGGAFIDVPAGDGSARMLATPVDFGDHVPTAVRAAPEPGQHTEEVLLELGYDWDTIAELKATGVIP